MIAMFYSDLTLRPLQYGGVQELNTKNTQQNNAQLRAMIKELQHNPTPAETQKTYTFVLASLLAQNNTLLKRTFNKFMDSQYKQSNPTLTPYEIMLISDALYRTYRIRQDFTNERLKDLVKKDYNTQLALLSGVMIGSRNTQKTIKQSIMDLQGKANDILDDDMHRLRGDLNATVAKEYGAIGYIWKNQQDNRVVGNPMGIYPIVKNPIAHGNHWIRENKLYLYEPPSKALKKELKEKKIPYELDQDLLDGSPGEPYGCRCFRINIYEVSQIK